MGVEDWFPQRPHFLQLCQLLYFLGTLLSHSFGTRLHLGIQYLLMNTVGGPVKIYAQNYLQARLSEVNRQ